MQKTTLVIASFLLLCAAIFAQESIPLGTRIVNAAREQVGVTTSYDPNYVTLSYPGGDVPLNTGVCCDVVIRALRKTGLDLQKEVHEDMAKNFAVYPKKWGLKAPDSNIDHRRVPNLMRYFERHQNSFRAMLNDARSYKPGDIVTWDLGNGLVHIGIVSDKSSESTPLIIHNIGRGAQEENILFQYKVIGHYRLKEQVREKPIADNR